MLGLLYLFLCFGVGWAICSYEFPNLSKLTESSYDKGRITLSPYLLQLPVWFVIGVLALTWPVYIIATLASGITETPLIIADAIVMPAALLAFAAVFYRKRIRNKQQTVSFFCPNKRTRLFELTLLAGITVLACVLMITTFYVKEGQLHIGVSVFSDFSPHIGMIRSFSYGNNYPTAYSHYGGEDIRYHFMFQFLAGNLEFLGMRIDYAFNLPSILSFIGAFMLLYVLAVKITGKALAGLLSCLFFAFRSSKSLFTYLSGIPKGESILRTLQENTNFIGDTPNEDWGLWNLNVYCNQRHLAFGLAAMFFLLILFLPQLYEMFEAVKQYRFRRASEQRKIAGAKAATLNSVKELLSHIKLMFFTKEGWQVKDVKTAVAAGLLLGALSFFHGSVVIGCLLILFMMAAFSRRRLEYVIVAAITMALSMLQTGYFIKDSAVATKYLFGFIAENPTLFGAASYLDRLLGILPLVLLAAFCFEKGVGRYLILAFSVPLIFAFTVSMTVDVTVNHKYIMMSCILLGIFAAGFVELLLVRRDIFLRLTGVLLIILLTSTGIYDFTTVLRKNVREGGIVLNLEDDLTKFVRENSNSKDLFLTNSTNYTINQLVFGGAMLYLGHPYYAWSAGYDTDYRDYMVRRMYSAETPEELKSLVKENNIRFIVVGNENRVSTEYLLNEENIRATYESVYDEGEGEWKISIYDTLKEKS
jgi:hypothetical protein